MDKTGHWILDSIVSMDNTNIKTFIYKCSECGFYTTSNRTDVCRHCGAKMNNQEQGKNRTEGRKMTNQDAIDYLLDPIGKREQHDEAIALAVSALKKQIPVKPTRIDKNETFDGNWIKVCPSCGRILIERITTPVDSFPRYYNYTQHCGCGQAIDWDNTENLENKDD